MLSINMAIMHVAWVNGHIAIQFGQFHGVWSWYLRFVHMPQSSGF